MAWVKIQSDAGRVNLDVVPALLISQSGGTWRVEALMPNSTTYFLASGLTAQADAVAFVDALLVDGS